MTQLPHRAALAILAGGCLLAGCAAGPKPPLASARNHAAADPATFVQLEPAVADVDCTGRYERVLPDGRLEVVANVTNRGERPLRVQASCVFRDVDSFSVGDDTPFQTFALAAGATESVRFTSRGMQARRYTIRVRTAR
ncbi:MAG TPA: hypothetical protein VHE13_15320 [Opitutus sp.]|nr:hypothetical protein [Opitutus sp.]